MQNRSTLGAIMAVFMAATAVAAPANAAPAHVTRTLTAAPPAPSPGFGTTSSSNHLGSPLSGICTRCCTIDNRWSYSVPLVVKIQDCVRLRDYIIEKKDLPNAQGPTFGVGSCQIQVTPKSNNNVHIGYEDILSMLCSTIHNLEASGSSTIAIFTSTCHGEGKPSSGEVDVVIGNPPLKGD